MPNCLTEIDHHYDIIKFAKPLKCEGKKETPGLCLEIFKESHENK